MKLAPINYQKSNLTKNNTSFKNNIKNKIIQEGAGTIDTKVVPAAIALATLVVSKSLIKEKMSYEERKMEECREANVDFIKQHALLTGIPRNIDDMRARFVQIKNDASNPIIAELENAMIVHPAKISTGIYFDKNDSDERIYKTSDFGQDTSKINHSVDFYNHEGQHEIFYDSKGTLIGHNGYYTDFNSIERRANDGRYICKEINNDGMVEKYSVSYEDSVLKYADKGSGELRELNFSPEGKITGIECLTKAEDGTKVLFMEDIEEDNYDNNGNITLERIEEGRKFVIKIENTGKLINIEEIPCTETYYKEVFAKYPEFKEVIDEFNKESKIGDYDLNEFAKRILNNPECTKKMIEAKRKDGTPRYNNYEIVNIALLDPGYGTESFINSYIDSNDSRSAYEIWSYRWH